MIKIIISVCTFLLTTCSQAALSPEYELPKRYERLKVIAQKIENSNTKGIFYVKNANFSKVSEDYCSIIKSANIKIHPINNNKIIWNETYVIKYNFSEQLCPGPFIEKAIKVEKDTIYTMSLECSSNKICKPSSDSHYTQSVSEINRQLEDLGLAIIDFPIDSERQSPERLEYLKRLKTEIAEFRYDEYKFIITQSWAGEPLHQFIHAVYLECGIYEPKNHNKALELYKKSAKKDFKPAIFRLSAKEILFPCL